MGKRGMQDGAVEIVPATTAEKKAIREIHNYFLEHPSEAPSSLLLLQDGTFKAKTAQLDVDAIPGYSSISQVSSDTIRGVCSALQPSLTDDIRVKILRKGKDVRADGNNKKIEYRIYYLMTGDKPASPLICCSKQLLNQIHVQEQLCSHHRPLVLSPDFSVDFVNNGVFKLVDIVDGEEPVYSFLLHISGVKAIKQLIN